MKKFISEDNLKCFIKEFAAEIDYDVSKELIEDHEWMDELCDSTEVLIDKWLHQLTD